MKLEIGPAIVLGSPTMLTRDATPANTKKAAQAQTALVENPGRPVARGAALDGGQPEPRAARAVLTRQSEQPLAACNDGSAVTLVGVQVEIFHVDYDAAAAVVTRSRKSSTAGFSAGRRPPGGRPGDLHAADQPFQGPGGGRHLADDRRFRLHGLPPRRRPAGAVTDGNAEDQLCATAARCRKTTARSPGRASAGSGQAVPHREAWLGKSCRAVWTKENSVTMSFKAEIRASLGWNWNHGAVDNSRLDHTKPLARASATARPRPRGTRGANALGRGGRRDRSDGAAARVLGSVLMTDAVCAVRGSPIVNDAGSTGTLIVGGADDGRVVGPLRRRRRYARSPARRHPAGVQPQPAAGPWTVP